MAETTISWTHKRLPGGAMLPGYTFNPWFGCQKVSPACDFCYAEALMDLRYGKVKWGPHGERKRTAPANWRKPIQWDKKAAAAGVKPYVFCASLADVFDNQVNPQWRRDLFDLIRATTNLEWLLLTKRPQNIVKMCAEAGGLPPNAAIGTTIEDQTRADLNVPHLLRAKAEVKPLFVFVSCEPLLGPITLNRMKLGGGWYDALGGWRDVKDRFPGFEETLDWVITGGETNQGGQTARPSHHNWFRSLRDQCLAAGVRYHHKQNGEWMPHKVVAGGDLGGDVRSGRVTIVHPTGQSDQEVFVATGGRNTVPGSTYMARVGKKSAGRLLDGFEHHEHPGAP